MKVKRIKIKPIEDGLKDFKRIYKIAASGKPIRKREGVFFSSIAAARKVLTEGRINLLKAIKKLKPDSIYQLAKLTHRDFKNVSQDISFLSELGLVELGKASGARNQRKPRLVSDHIYVELSI